MKSISLKYPYYTLGFMRFILKCVLSFPHIDKIHFVVGSKNYSDREFLFESQ